MCVRLTDASVASESLAERKRRTTNFHREPCAGHREVSGEASAAACMGRAIEPRNFAFRMCRDRRSNRRQHFQAVMVRRRKASRGPRTMARTEALHRDLSSTLYKKRSCSGPKNSVCGDLHQGLLNGQNVPSEVPNILSSFPVELQPYFNFVI